jgi:hypothetical protein
MSHGNHLPQEEKEQEMRNIVRIIGVSLVSMAGILLVSGVAWAQAEETPITVRVMGCEVLEQEPDRREWVDEDGIRHVRDHMFRCSVRRDMVGTITGWNNKDEVPGACDHFQHGYYSFVGTLLGEPATAVGRVTHERNMIEGVCTLTQEDVMHLDGGGLVLLSGTWEWGERVIFRGVLIDPPGGAKRQGPRPRR